MAGNPETPKVSWQVNGRPVTSPHKEREWVSRNDKLRIATVFFLKDSAHLDCGRTGEEARVL